MPDNDLLAQLHSVLLAELLRKIKAGDAAPSDLNVARQFLKDNGIDSTPEASPKMRDLEQVLPFPRAVEDVA